MRTLKISTAIATLNLALFMSVVTTANPFTSNTGDVVKSGVKKQITLAGNALSNKADSDFNYLRFDVTKFTSETDIDELPATNMDYLRFDLKKYIDGKNTEITELPAETAYGYLRFDINEFISISNADNFELPESDFEYLRFNVNNYTGSEAKEITELPAI